MVPIEDEFLKKYNFFELYPLDGGGRFAFNDAFGTVDDNLIAEMVFKENRLPGAGKLPDVDFRQFERWRSIEKSCALNRFYFLPPLAKSCWLSRDHEKAVLLKDTILNFIRKHHPPSGREETGRHLRRVLEKRDGYNANTYRQNQEDETDVEYVWFDFQPASRILHLLYAEYFLRGSEGISREEWEEIYRGIYAHAETIYNAEEYFLELKKGNHQSLRGLALLYAGCFFRERPGGERFLKKGIEICDFHIENDFLDDGALRENSPSYHVFETWHMRDACRLSEIYGFNLSSNPAEKLKKAAGFIKAVTCPDSRTTVINDGYPVDSGIFLKTLPFSGKQGGGAHYYGDAGIGISTDDCRYLVLDASSFRGHNSHYHGGKNAVTYWFAGKPFFVDSGCCSYDDELFAGWYKKGEAHSSLLVDGVPDSVNEGTYAWSSYARPACAGWKTKGEEHGISSTITSSSPGWENVSWTRKITLPGVRRLRLADELNFSGKKTFEFIFNLHPDVEAEESGDGIALRSGGSELKVGFVCKEQYGIFFSPGKCFIDFRHAGTQRIIVRINASSDLCLETHVTGEA